MRALLLELGLPRDSAYNLAAFSAAIDVIVEGDPALQDVWLRQLRLNLGSTEELLFGGAQQKVAKSRSKSGAA